MTDTRVLIVDTDPGRWSSLCLVPGMNVDLQTDFGSARKSLLREPPSFLITSLRLGAFNGLHLIYLAMANRSRTRAIAFGSLVDLPLIQEAQEIGAFFEASNRALHAIPSYIGALLPLRDRRTPRENDRRREYRGGRRAADVAAIVVAT